MADVQWQAASTRLMMRLRDALRLAPRDEEFLVERETFGTLLEEAGTVVDACSYAAVAARVDRHLVEVAEKVRLFRATSLRPSRHAKD